VQAQTVHEQLVVAYRGARFAWRNPDVRAAADFLGMDERDFCDYVVRRWREPVASQAEYDAAFEGAKPTDG